MFQPKIIKTFIQKLDTKALATAYENLKLYQAKSEAIKTFKEEVYQDGFLKEIFENCLGYTLDTTDPANFNLKREMKNETDAKKADAVIIKDNAVIGVIELKDTTTKELKSIESQAFNYHNSHSNSRYIITSNFEKLRFYIDKKVEFREFGLFSMSFDEFKELYLLLSFDSISKDIPLVLKERSTNFDNEISKNLYKDYSNFRLNLFDNLVKNNEQIPKERLLNHTSKLCDRIIFILFAEDRGLLKPNTINEIKKRHEQDIFNVSLYGYYKIYFEAINLGNDKLEIPAYNGGLFAKDLELDNLIIDDDALNAKALSNYDFASEISVNILGHIFEQSLTDLEELQAEIENKDFDKTKTKRKKDGIFYTPEYITKYIVENTLGKICENKKDELNLHNIEIPKNPKRLTKKESQTLANIHAYRKFLLNLKILDPACGSGAFLNQALEFLITEHGEIDRLRRGFEGDALGFYDIETDILENNLYGVDINKDAVEIAKLSLWLRTARKGRTLTNLSDKILCSNSLLDMPFPESSFDIVIGNPPYVRQEAIKEQKEALSQIYEVYNGTADLYVYFYELGLKMLKNGGYLGFICSNKFFRAKYGTNLRKFILENSSVKGIVDFSGVQVFEDATVDSAITIFKKEISENSSFKFSSNLDETPQILPQNSLSEESFIFLNPLENSIKQKIENKGTPLKEWDITIYRGVTTGLNNAFIIDTKTKDEILSSCKSIDEKGKTTAIIKPLLRGRDIKRYSYEWANLWIICTFPSLNLDIENYPTLKEYLYKFMPQLNQSGEKGCRKKTNNKWFEIQDNTAYYNEFEKDKIRLN